ncbi:sugar transferase [Prevotella sp. KH2C16]|uniref:sugar transferase n=1 Tax=Prevotella sp. KH2C16 TaxID=1855325 RepID=UPI0008E025B9|nr:sugar transferase [Prevotella sp. KH2C16]SFG62280.1 Sugar transferase involved in LPS biosynthesis (colanic, teichoic acid) [Prevotella sp. KH2C16]
MAVQDGMGKTQLAIKRLTDIICASLGLILLSPLLLYIAIRLYRQNNGPVLFRQERVGKGGKTFTIYKFRTMPSIIEEDGPQLIATCDDSNSTRLEQMLRSHHLDELPQLWNVVRGDMSIVGPRPERKYFADKIMEVDSSYAQIYRMRPGLTSEATLYNGYTDTMEKMLTRLHMDLSYLERRSLWLDFKIAAKTAAVIITGKKF